MIPLKSFASRSWKALLLVCGFVTSNSQILCAQSAIVTGTMLVDGSNKTLANAEVTITDLNVSTRSDSAGNFRLSALPAGKHALVVRLPGFEAFNADVTIGATQTLDAEFMLKPLATELAKVNVKAIATGPYAIKLAEFEERRSVGMGKFLTADYFEKQDGRPPSSFLQSKIAGLRVINSNGRHWIASGRQTCGKTFGSCSPPLGKRITQEVIPDACYAKVIVNGRVEFNGDMEKQELFDIDKLDTKDIIGLEYYTDATMPLQYRGTSGAYGSCGAVVIWTK